MPSPIKVLDSTYLFTIGEGDDAIAVFECTTSVLDGFWFLSPDQRCVELVNGVFGRNQLLFDYELYGYHAMSTHMHCLLGVKAVEVKAAVMEHLNGNVAREINLHRERAGPFWQRSNRPIQIADAAYLEQRLAYIMLQAVTANVVSKAASTPFPSANPWLLEGKTIKGAWVDRSAMYEFGRQTGRSASEADFTTWYPVRIDKLPHLRHLDDVEYRNFCRGLVKEAELEAARARRAGKRRFFGAAKARGVDPYQRTPLAQRPRSHAPALHGDAAARQAFRGRYRTLLEGVRAVTASWRAHLAGALDMPLRYPGGTQPPGNLRGLIARAAALDVAPAPPQT